MTLEVFQLPVLSDNYIYVLRDTESRTVGVVDPAEAQPVVSFLNEKNWKLDFVLNTHHHWDHTGGNLELKSQFQCQIVGHSADAQRIPGIDLHVTEGDIFSLGASRATVLDVSGHTVGHIAFYFPEAHKLFCGDTLFSMGCGRLFEGQPAQMWDSLIKIRNLPDDTLVYCAHEYTQSNGKFALTVDPENLKLVERMIEVNKLRAQGRPTVPSLLGIEKQTNPFLRADCQDFQVSLGMKGKDPVEIFAWTRKKKDTF